jgi:glycosyltransferase involved in cell wall biosynthesis
LVGGSRKKQFAFHGCRVHKINPGLDLNIFKPIDKKIARTILNLSQEKTLILYGAIHSTTDTNKGFHYLKSAIQILKMKGWGTLSELLIFGSSDQKYTIDSKMKTHYFGRIYDEISLSIIYSAADVMVVPSIQESFGQTASEAMACGTPVVAFGATGLLDIVDHKKTGYLAIPFEPNDLANGIEWILQDDNRRIGLSELARMKAVKAFSIDLMAKRYISLYKEIMQNE